MSSTLLILAALVAVSEAAPRPLQVKFRIGAISDMDKASKDPKSKPGKEKWLSYLMKADLTFDPTRSYIKVDWDEKRTHTVSSGFSYSGRGMELSTLNVFNGHLYACDDRTGVVYELPLTGALKVNPIPWVILADGNFTGPKGFKCEWGTVKDGDLWIGGMGVALVDKNGDVISSNPKWVKRITPKGEVTHLDWTNNFDKMANALNIHFPGYVDHESAGWSDILQKWVFMPRKVSKVKFEDKADETAGSNVVLVADENFDDIQVTHVGALVPTHGFACFKFIPGTRDQSIVALKSVETEGKVETYIMAFDLSGKVLLEETKFADQKYEGVEFLDLFPET